MMLRAAKNRVVQAARRGAGSAPLSLHCPGCGRLSPEHTGPCLGPSDGTVTSGLWHRAPRPVWLQRPPFWFRWYREPCPDGVYSRMTSVCICIFVD